jgi:hypothetical protein
MGSRQETLIRRILYFNVSVLVGMRVGSTRIMIAATEYNGYLNNLSNKWHCSILHISSAVELGIGGTGNDGPIASFLSIHQHIPMAWISFHTGDGHVNATAHTMWRLLGAVAARFAALKRRLSSKVRGFRVVVPIIVVERPKIQIDPYTTIASNWASHHWYNASREPWP